MHAKPLITTARTKSHMSAAEVQALQAKLTPHLVTSAWLAQPPAPLEVEVGMGNGAAILQRALAAPQQHFLGIEVFLNGLRSLQPHLASAPNLHISSQDARHVLAQLPAASVQRLVVPHPDPWPKARHHKRRLINSTFLAEAARILTSGGELWVVTDWPDYAFHTLSQLYLSPQFTLAQTEQAAARCKTNPKEGEAPNPTILGPQHLATPPAWWVPTKYGQKALTLGRQPWFIMAQKSPH